MMSNDSSTGGFIAPLPSPSPLEGQELNRFLQQAIVGITGLDGKLVRPGWQVDPANLPDRTVDWASFRITMRPSDTFAAEIHSPAGNGHDTLIRQEILEVLVTFYGPDADKYSAILRDGFSVAQNREVFQLNGMGFVSCGDLVSIPELLKGQWLYRVDLPFDLRRAVERAYPVLNLESAAGTISYETGEVGFNTNP